MLSPDDARQRLQQFEVPDASKLRRQRLEALAATLPSDDRLGQFALLLAKEIPPRRLTDSEHPRLEDRWAELDMLPGDRRMVLWSALFPQLAEDLERMWRRHSYLPYQGGWTRRPFRAPTQPAWSADRVGAFITSYLRGFANYEPDSAWLAEWSGHLPAGYHLSGLAPLLAASIGGGSEVGTAVFAHCAEIARNRHPISGINSTALGALMLSERTDGWELVERLLLAAQREEGLRQSILETADECQPGAFLRLLRAIQREDLLRFSSVLRSVGVWLGFELGVEHGSEARSTLAQLDTYLTSPEERALAFVEAPGARVFLALWAEAFFNASSALEQATHLLADGNSLRRSAAVELLLRLGRPEATAALARALADPDPLVAAAALPAMWWFHHDTAVPAGAYEGCLALAPRLPEANTYWRHPLWSWGSVSGSRQNAYRLAIRLRETRSPEELLPLIPVLDPSNRSELVDALAKHQPQTPTIRQALLHACGDASDGVRRNALDAVKKMELSPAEAREMEPLLRRKAADLRQGVLTALLKMPDAEALASADRLLTAKESGQRAAGLELLREMAAANRQPENARARALRYQTERPKRTDAETLQLEAILGPALLGESVAEAQPVLADGFGLYRPEERSVGPFPRELGARLNTPGSLKLAQSLCDFILEHAKESFRIKRAYDSSETDVLLGDMQYSFPSPDSNVPAEEDWARLPLADLWLQWRRELSDHERDPDGLELLRACVHLRTGQGYLPYWVAGGGREEELPGRHPVEARTWQIAIGHSVCEWLLRREAAPNATDTALDLLETALARVPFNAYAGRGRHAWGGPIARWDVGPDELLTLTRFLRRVLPERWFSEHDIRLWSLLCWIDSPRERPAENPAAKFSNATQAIAEALEAEEETLRIYGHRYRNDEDSKDLPLSGIFRHPGELEDVLRAHALNVATDADLYDLLLPPDNTFGRKRGSCSFDLLGRYTGRKTDPLRTQFPALQQAVDRIRERVVEIEVRRGETATEATPVAQVLQYSGGADVLAALLRALGKDTLKRTPTWYTSSDDRSSVFSELILATFPSKEDTFARFRELVEPLKLPQRRLVEVAVCAPHWAAHIEALLDWSGLASGVWWFHAHTRDPAYGWDQEGRDALYAQIAQYTPIQGEDLTEGAADVEWFHQAFGRLGVERWAELHRAARLATTGVGHTRARLFAEAMSGQITPEELMARARDKRHQDSIRALGLAPLSRDEAEVLERYTLLQEFLRTSRQFGAMRQESERKAVRIGMDNLARTAGYADPVRLTWAMEAQDAADLAEGPATVEVGNVTVSLALNEQGEPELVASRAGRTLKNVPATARKVPEVVALRQRATELRRKESRIRQSLEQAMVLGDAFRAEELVTLAGHPLLAPPLRKLVLVGQDLAGYLADDGKSLRGPRGEISPIPADAELRVAHPHDLLTRGDWPEWQHECFRSERIQPFKQLFRELYVVTAAERDLGTRSTRYAGHQVQPTQAAALLKTRGWTLGYEEDPARTFHRARITAHLEFQSGFLTPGEVENPEIGQVWFTRSREWQSLPLTEVPPLLFSEVMRDLDLVVSVAHAGGVDPEATESTIETRAMLVRELSGLLGLDNVEVNGPRAMISGRLAHWSVHLGSGVVHRLPGGSVCIVPVQSQHRGRIFLPFADNDPKSAEVLAKVLLLARDYEIRDPTILSQLTG